MQKLIHRVRLVALTIAALSMSWIGIFVLFKMYERELCSDDPICDKWNCERGNESACEMWERSCENFPDTEGCSV